MVVQELLEVWKVEEEDATSFAQTSKPLVLVAEQCDVSLLLVQVVHILLVVVPGFMAIFWSLCRSIC